MASKSSNVFIIASVSMKGTPNLGCFVFPVFAANCAAFTVRAFGDFDLRDFVFALLGLGVMGLPFGLGKKEINKTFYSRLRFVVG